MKKSMIITLFVFLGIVLLSGVGLNFMKNKEPSKIEHKNELYVSEEAEDVVQLIIQVEEIRVNQDKTTVLGKKKSGILVSYELASSVEEIEARIDGTKNLTLYSYTTTNSSKKINDTDVYIAFGFARMIVVGLVVVLLFYDRKGE